MEVIESYGGTIKRYKGHRLKAQGERNETVVACTAYGTGAAWYFLAKASEARSRNQGYRYSLSKDLANGLDDYLGIEKITLGLYATCPKDSSGFMIAEERYGDGKLDKIATNANVAIPQRLRTLLAMNPMVSPNRSTLGVGQLVGAMRDVSFQANFYLDDKDPSYGEPRAIKHVEIPPNYPVDKVKPSEKEIFDGIVEALATFTYTKNSNVPTRIAEIKRNARELADLVKLYMHLNINGNQPLGPSSSIRVLQSYMDAQEIKELQTEKRHKDKLAGLMRMMALQRQALESASLSQWIQTNGNVVKNLCDEIVKVTTEVQTFYAPENKDKMEIDEPPRSNRYDTLTYDESLTLNSIKFSTSFEEIKGANAIYASPGHINSLSPLAVFASALENSPIMRLAGKRLDNGLKHVPFAIVLSVNQAMTTCLFKDGFADSPYIYFDSHGRGLASFTEYATIASLNNLAFYDGVVVEIFVLQRDLNNIKDVGGAYYVQHFPVPIVSADQMLRRFGDDLLPNKK